MHSKWKTTAMRDRHLNTQLFYLVVSGCLSKTNWGVTDDSLKSTPPSIHATVSSRHAASIPELDEAIPAASDDLRGLVREPHAADAHLVVSLELAI